jgi:hypothetical protein
MKGDFVGGHYETINFDFSPFDGVKTYSKSDTSDNVSISYDRFGDVHKTYEVFTGNGGWLTVNVTENANNILKGTFEGKLFKYDIDLLGPDTTDVVIFTEGRFHLKKN